MGQAGWRASRRTRQILGWWKGSRELGGMCGLREGVQVGSGRREGVLNRERCHPGWHRRGPRPRRHARPYRGGRRRLAERRGVNGRRVEGNV